MALSRQLKAIWKTIQPDQKRYGNRRLQIRRHKQCWKTKINPFQGKRKTHSRKAKIGRTKEANPSWKGKQYETDWRKGKAEQREVRNGKETERRGRK